ncbi:hypothetical protein [Streptomyces rochei]|uniref:hypothetical protein n=1 Tax=Streptomyces rochei TaxID=1928 RepID=UPI0037A3D3D5
MLSIGNVPAEAGRGANQLIRRGSAARTVLPLPSRTGLKMGGSAGGIRDEHQQLDPSKRVYGEAGRAGQELDPLSASHLVGVCHKPLDLVGQHVNVVTHRNPLLVVANGEGIVSGDCWLQPTDSPHRLVLRLRPTEEIARLRASDQPKNEAGIQALAVPVDDGDTPTACLFRQQLNGIGL